jgi:hypothetical protein
MSMTSTHQSTARRAGTTILQRLLRIYIGLAELGANSPRARQLDALWSLSDAELAARGLRRQDIVPLVIPEAGLS